MRTRLLAAILLGCLSCSAGAQISSSDSTAPSVASREPQIIPTQMPLTPEGKCKKTRPESAMIVVFISDRGIPREPYFQEVSGDLAADWAMLAVLTDRFQPAKQSGMPIGVWRTISVSMDACVEKAKLPDGSKGERLWLKALPQQSIRPLQMIGASSGWHRSSPLQIQRSPITLEEGYRLP